METIQVKLDGTTFGEAWQQRKEEFAIEWVPVEKSGGIQPGNFTSFMTQFNSLFSRGWFLILRDPRIFTTRMASVLTTVVLVGGMFPNLGNSQLAIRDQQGFIVLSQMYLGMDGAIQQAIVFPLEKMVVYREYNNGAYSIGAYYASKYILSYMFQAFYIFVYIMITYFIVGLRLGADHIFGYLLPHLIVGSFTVGFGFIVGVVSISVMMANVLITPNYMMFIIFNGFIVNQAYIPGYFYWMYVLNPLNYSLQTMLISQYKGHSMDDCSATDLGHCPYGPGIVSGKAVLKNFSIDDTDFLFSVLATMFFSVQLVQMGFMVITHMANKFKY